MNKLIIGFALTSTIWCININNHIHGEADVYGGTCSVSKMIATPFVGSTGPERVYDEAYSTILLPFNIIDLPLEVVADTLTLPYDIVK